MTILLSNATINNDAPAQTIIGTLSAQDQSGNVIPCNFSLTKGSIGYFAVSGNQLVTAWSSPAAPGFYSVRVHAIGSTMRFSGRATFTIAVAAASSPPPPPPSSHAVVIGLAEDAYQGDAQYSLAVDGSVVIPGGTVTVLKQLRHFSGCPHQCLGWLAHDRRHIPQRCLWRFARARSKPLRQLCEIRRRRSSGGTGNASAYRRQFLCDCRVRRRATADSRAAAACNHRDPEHSPGARHDASRRCRCDLCRLNERRLSLFRDSAIRRAEFRRRRDFCAVRKQYHCQSQWSGCWPKYDDHHRSHHVASNRVIANAAAGNRDASFHDGGNVHLITGTADGMSLIM